MSLFNAIFLSECSFATFDANPIESHIIAYSVLILWYSIGYLHHFGVFQAPTTPSIIVVYHATVTIIVDLYYTAVVVMSAIIVIDVIATKP